MSEERVKQLENRKAEILTKIDELGSELRRINGQIRSSIDVEELSSLLPRKEAIALVIPRYEALLPQIDHDISQAKEQIDLRAGAVKQTEAKIIELKQQIYRQTVVREEAEVRLWNLVHNTNFADERERNFEVERANGDLEVIQGIIEQLNQKLASTELYLRQITAPSLQEIAKRVTQLTA